ncbi:MAG: 50S ribosomal protein L4 [Candidatus Aenigmatarchaeota archaeon]|nr:MAG: 50S ribosomal protein L4 [Candidatus Aenigmarchaeota archaeon]
MASQVPVYSVSGSEKGKMNIAKPFSKRVREDLIKRAVLAERSGNRQPYGSDPLAGKRTSAHYHGMRHYKYSMMNKEMARMKRIHGSGFLSYTARFVPQAIKGRKAHPPKAEKVWKEKINKKEWLNALYSAIAASGKKETVASRNHDVDSIKNVPLVVEDKLQELSKTSDLKKTLESLGVSGELKKASKKKARAGRGKTRGRRARTRKGPLIIVSDDKGIKKSASNIAGVDAIELKNLSVEMLAPGTHPGRLCIWTRSAMEELNKSAK